MTALAAQKPSLIEFFTFPGLRDEKGIAATQTIYKGALLALNTAGYVVPAAATAGLRVIGVADTGSYSYTNTTGVAAGAKTVLVKRGLFGFVNDTDAVTQADVGRDVYAVDDQTISKTDGGVGRPIAGQLWGLEGTTPIVAVGFAPFRNSPDYVAPTTVISGAIPVTSGSDMSLISVTGTAAYTLADGVYIGQKKLLRCTVAATTPVGTITPAHVSGYTTIVFTAVDDWALLEWNGAAWILGPNKQTPALIAATTVTSGAIPVTDGSTVSLISVTGTVAYTMAAGTRVGQLKTLICTVAGSTPHGTVTPAAVANYVSFELNAVGQTICLRWNGAAWEIQSAYVGTLTLT